MSMLTVTVPGNPIPYTRIASRNGQRFTPPALRSYLGTLRVYAIQATAQAARAGIRWPRAGAHYSLLVLVVRKDRHPFDADNVLKTACDGMTGPSGLWLDDRDVVDARVVRCAPDAENPRLVVMASTRPAPMAIEELDWIVGGRFPERLAPQRTA